MSEIASTIINDFIGDSMFPESAMNNVEKSKAELIRQQCSDFCVVTDGTRQTLFWSEGRKDLLCYPSRKLMYDGTAQTWDMNLFTLTYRK